MIMCDEIIETTKFDQNCSKEELQQILLTFLLITIALFIAASIYCYLIKNKTK